MIANMLQMSYHFDPRYAQIRAEGKTPALPGVLPNANAAGMILCTMLPLHMGWKVYPMPKYDLPVLMSKIKKFDLSVLFLAPAIYQRIANEYASSDVKNIRFAMSGGSILPLALQQRNSNIFAPGINLVTNYGMLEATCQATQFAPSEIDEEENVGRLVPNMEAIVVDKEGRRLEADEVGELCFRGPDIAKGYFQNEEATRSTFTKDGFLRTGDMAVSSKSGKVFIRGRCKIPRNTIDEIDRKFLRMWCEEDMQHADKSKARPRL